MFDYKNKSSERHVKETVPIWSQKWLFPTTVRPLHIYTRFDEGYTVV